MMAVSGEIGPQRIGVCSVVGCIIYSAAVCFCVQDWFLALPLAISSILFWSVRRDIYAAMPGFLIGFLLGVITSAGIGPLAALDCGMFAGAIGVPVNVMCRGHWRSALAALAGILTYIGVGAVICQMCTQ
jgi:hypothetical protein